MNTGPPSIRRFAAGTLAPALGLANLPLGLGNGLILSAIPQLLAGRHVPEPVIADITSIGLIPGFAVFLLGPLLDRGPSRRVYAVCMTVATALAALVAVRALAQPVLLGAAVFVVSAASSLNLMAFGGWFGSVLDERNDASLGAGMSVAFAVGFSLAAVIDVPVMHALPPGGAAILLALPFLAPLPIYALAPAGPAVPRGASGEFVRGIQAMFRQRDVRWLLVLFALPTGCFALTNTLSGLGADYRASERAVGLINSVAVTLTGVAGALLVPMLVRRTATWKLYLGTGTLGAIVTLVLASLPRTPAAFAFATVAENLAQAVTLTSVTVAALQSLDRGAPWAATQFGLLTALPQLPITYMQWLDGHAYGKGGLGMMYLADGGLGLVSCLLIGIVTRLGPRP